MKNFNQRDFIWILPLSLGLGAVLSVSAAWQLADRLAGIFFPLPSYFFTSHSLHKMGKWRRSRHASAATKTLAWMVALAFALRFVGGVATYLVLPIYGL